MCVFFSTASKSFIYSTVIHVSFGISSAFLLYAPSMLHLKSLYENAIMLYSNIIQRMQLSFLLVMLNKPFQWLAFYLMYIIVSYSIDRPPPICNVHYKNRFIRSSGCKPPWLRVLMGAGK